MTSQNPPTEETENQSPSEPEEPISGPERLDEEGLAALARGIVTNEIFFTNTEQGIQNSFSLMLAFILPRMSDDDIRTIGGLYAPYANAGERGVNGYPFFFECRMVHVDDLDPLFAKMSEMMEALGLPPLNLSGESGQTD